MQIGNSIMQQEAKKKVRPKKDVLCMKIYGNKVFFKQYLQQQIGVSWKHIKDSLYDAGYSCSEVNEYRNRLIEDFKKVCKKNNLNGII